MKEIYIYALVDPISDQPRYVGKAIDLTRRHKAHICDIKSNTHKSKWIKSLRTFGLKPIIEILDIVNEDEWIFWEQHYISLYQSWGFKLTNGTSGGDGIIDWTPEMRKNHSVSLRTSKIFQDKLKSPEYRSNLSKALLNAYETGTKKSYAFTDEIRDKISKGVSKANYKPDSYCQSPELKQKRHDDCIKGWATRRKRKSFTIKVSQYLIETCKLINIFDSMNQFKTHLNLRPSQIDKLRLTGELILGEHRFTIKIE